MRRFLEVQGISKVQGREGAKVRAMHCSAWVALVALVVLLSSCGGGHQASTHDEGDTLHLKYAKNLTIVRHDGYTEVCLKDPWNQGKTLHRYVLVPPGGDGKGATIVHVPLQRAVVGTSVLCGLIDRLGRRDIIGGVCDVQYVNIPFVQEGCRKGTIADCGSGLAPTLEKIIDLEPDAICLSPFQNSGGYGRIEELDVPIIEMADYMETSALGRAEWVKFYGMLFGAEQEADSLFQVVEADYLRLKELAKTAKTQPSVLMDKQTGSVWYVPAGNGTVGRIIQDANIRYAWADTQESGSLPLPFETILEKAGGADIWLFRYNAPQPITYSALLSENNGYSQFKAFQQRSSYGCNTATTTFYEETPFHPNLLLRDFISIAHPELGLGEPRYFLPVK